MKGTASRLWISLVIVVVYLVIAIQGANVLMAEGESSLVDLFMNGIGWHIVLGTTILLAAIAIFRWNDLRFGKPHSVVRVMWFPTIFLVGFTVGLIQLGFPPLAATLLLLVNAMLVGFAEEVLFRGIVFRALEERVSLWTAIIVTTLLFGAPHVFNVFITGELFMAAIQAAAAAFTGFVLIAMLIRTGSLWPGIIYHGLWDFLNYCIEARVTETGTELSLMSGWWSLVWIGANGLFGLYLLRHEKNRRGE